MKQIQVALLLAALLFTRAIWAQGSAASAPQAQPPAARVVDLKASDGVVLKASYFAAARPGPGVLLFHQSNRTRKAWDDVAGQLAAAGIHVLTIDSRGLGESGGNRKENRKQWRRTDLDTAFQYLVSQPGVDRDLIGVGGAGVIGVEDAVETARRHPAGMRSLVLLSGETDLDGMGYLRQASQLPELFVAADNDEYPPIVEAMQLLYITASSPYRRFVHYSAAHEAPWLWYEPFDIGRVPASGGHGTDLLTSHPELPGILVEWFVATLIKTPGHAPVDGVAAAAVLNQLESGGAAQVAQQLLQARKSDPQAQLFPEITASTIGQDYMRAGDAKSAVEVLEVVLLAYPGSADANETLAEAYLADGRKELAGRHARKALAILDTPGVPASSWTDTEQYRGEIRRGAQRVLKTLSESGSSAPAGATSAHVPGEAFRDCPQCPEMVVLPAGELTMGSSAEEKSWAVSHGATVGSVSDESPQHPVTLRTFALGKYDVTRDEYAAFVRETGHTAGDGCYESGNPDAKKHARASWQEPGFPQTGRSPVICISWEDAHAYVSWLNGKAHRSGSASGQGAYRLPSEAEWEYAARAGTTTRFWWGDDDSGAPGHAWYKSNSGGQSHPVGLKPANPFGLYDIVGDVWQWTEDCYAENYDKAPADGSAAEGGAGCLRVDRGGSWYYPAWLLRSATRERNPAGYRDRVMGFRAARTLP